MKKKTYFKLSLFLLVLFACFSISHNSNAQVIKKETHETVKGHYSLGGIAIGIGTKYMNCDGTGSLTCRVPL